MRRGDTGSALGDVPLACEETRAASACVCVCDGVWCGAVQGARSALGPDGCALAVQRVMEDNETVWLYLYSE